MREEQIMNPEKITINSFCLIGKAGSTEEGPGIVQRLWQDANEHFAEVAPLAKKNADGQPAGFWGAMSRSDMSFLPWEDDFSRGLYMAGVEAEEDALPPAGWKKWIVPGFECLKVPFEGPDTFGKMLGWMKANGFELAAAVQDFTDPATQKNYMLFPVAWNDSKQELLRRVKAKTDPVAFCGFHCDHCFLTEWCGNCRSACNMCSYATLSHDNRCENEKCCSEKGLYGCWECPGLRDCRKGFFSEPSGSIPKACALFIGKYGKDEYSRVLNTADEKQIKLSEEADTESNLQVLESLR